ncbi:acyl-CoA dehydratase activase [Ferrimonas lipolytica]|uniref:2-hydroxyglutaryl-CoA dehydratase n=1 Tax=Ferrimonas lipolytica TaxID=2724191 RepID=A0A6H1UAG1_9GAMM|nr:acyl-CoA dehydratase activase [Ferrimonas lipolytica]QIZ75570.1 2-hydroxyglutaryl-CoA dehydratase [Ferrimonas lipolytica]
MISCGIDIGSRTIKIALYDGSAVVDSMVTMSGSAPQQIAEECYQQLLNRNDLCSNGIAFTTATGYGRNYFSLADKASSEIICHSAGVAFLCPDAKTIIDIGGQDSKVMQLLDGGKVGDFAMNDRCAAGTGKFIEMVAQTLNIPVASTGALALSSNASCDISSMCAVFAESEVIGLLHKGIPAEVILRGIFDSVAKRVVSLGRKVGFRGPVVFTGGVAQNPGVVAAIQQQLIEHNIVTPNQPQLTGAIGAAIIGYRTAVARNSASASIGACQ